MPKISSKIVNPRDIAGNTEEEEEEYLSTCECGERASVPTNPAPSVMYTVHIAGMQSSQGWNS